MAAGDTDVQRETAVSERPAAKPVADSVIVPYGEPTEHVQYGPVGTPGPFDAKELERIDEALTMSSWESGVPFSLYVGDLGDDPQTGAEELHSLLGDRAADYCLVAVSPGQRVVHVVTGKNAARRLPDRSCALATLSMTAAFGSGDLVGGIVNGLRMLSDQAGHPHRR